jgi:hypothetical protein
MRQLLFRAQGGFANRLRAIVSAVLWAEDLDCELTIYWPVEPGHMPCALDDLLDRNSIPRVKTVIAEKLPGAVQIVSHDMMQGQKSKNEIRIESYSEFHAHQRAARGLTVLRGIRVRPELEQQAESLWKSIGGKSSWLGVHYRGTDHVKCIQQSPIECFIPYLNNETQGIFLATDDKQVKDLLTNSYTLNTLNIELGRFTSEQQIHGILEWLLLHKCGRVLQSTGSSYSELVTLRSGGILVRAQKNYSPIDPITQGNSIEVTTRSPSR